MTERKPTLGKFPTDNELREMNRMDDVPTDWTADCDNCRWFLRNFARADLYLFTNYTMREGKHVNARANAPMIGDGS